MPIPVFSVSECIDAINHHLSLLGEIVIEGEISRIDVKNGRLIFITITDPHSALDIFGLTHQITNLRQLEAGMLVRVHGTTGLYKGSGRFRIFASHIAPHGAGALQIALEKLRAQLEAEGLFDVSHKRPLPDWPQNIGLITAPNSSAYHDVVKVISARMGHLTIKHLPVTVQGRDAVPTLLKALEYINTHSHEFDVIILTRGGGSLEDLSAFNHEDIARAVFACKVPIVSAVGHEDDWSLTDFTADVRASTPSNAAQIVVKDRQEVRAQIDKLWQIAQIVMNNKIDQKQQQLHTITSNINNQMNQLKLSIQLIIARTVHAFTAYRNRLIISSSAVDEYAHFIPLLLKRRADQHRSNLDHLSRLIDSLNYQNVLKRGFSITSRLQGGIIRSCKNTSSGQTIITTLHDGDVTSTIN